MPLENALEGNNMMWLEDSSGNGHERAKIGGDGLRNRQAESELAKKEASPM